MSEEGRVESPAQRGRWARNAFALLVLSAMGMLSVGNLAYYFPTKTAYSEASSFRPGPEEVRFGGDEGDEFHGWLFKTDKTDPRSTATIIQFHGNAQNLTSHVHITNWLVAEGYNLFIFDYAGYGQSKGTWPTRSSVHESGVAALEFIRKRQDIDPNKLLVLGQSLGGAISMAALGEAGTDGVRGLVLESTFSSYQEVANAKLGGSFLTKPLVWALTTDAHAPQDHFDALRDLPVLVYHSNLDVVVPYEMGEMLVEDFNAARAPENPVHFESYETIPHLRLLAQEGPGTKALLKFFDHCLESH